MHIKYNDLGMHCVCDTSNILTSFVGIFSNHFDIKAGLFMHVCVKGLKLIFVTA